ncbi:hypothetical protein CCP3SC15_2900001 [Gammaproteobacteria bacterium]
MQARLVLEQNNVVIRFPKDLMSQEALSNLLGFIEFIALTKKGQLQTEAELVAQIQYEVAKNLNYAFLNDDVWHGELTPVDLADNHDRYLYDE